MIDNRIERLLTKAEQAIDNHDLEQADTYRALAGHVEYLKRREAKELNRLIKQAKEAE